MTKKILIWDNYGTIMGARHPHAHEPLKLVRFILPNVENTMTQDNVFNVICSGSKTPESELQNFDVDKIITIMKDLMEKLPVHVAAFSPAIGGVECYVIVKKQNTYDIRKAHDDPRYKELIGQFKKPSIGMFAVIRDILLNEFSLDITHATMIGDSWQDEEAAKSFGIKFKHAHHVHEGGML